MRVDVAIWLAAASLLETGRPSFTRAELLQAVSRQFPEAGASAALYIDVHVKATANRGTIAYNYLRPIGPRATYRLCRIGDDLPAHRHGLPLWPDEYDVEQQYRPLWTKWHRWQAGAAPTEVAAAPALAAEKEDEDEELAVQYRLSSYREAMLEHLLVGELMRALWPETLEVCKPQVDAAGYDLILQCRGVLRHVQLKTSTDGATTREVSVHVELEGRTSGCVIWTRFDPKSIRPTEFWWFGGAPGQPLPTISGYKVTKHTKANAQGIKTERSSHRKVPQSAFTRLSTVSQLIERLFGKGVSE